MSQFSSPEELEKVHVRNVYDQIAPRCTNVQNKAWPKVAEFLRSLPAGSLIADVGCGPGKYLDLVPSSFITGSDTCVQFIYTAREKQHEVCVCDNQLLPYRDGCFDAVISVGVIHHFASTKRRLRALRELARILKPGGQMLVYTWALEQSERKFSGNDVLVPYKGYHKSKGKRRKHICHFASNGEKGREQNGAREKCMCSVISHESLFEDKVRHRRAPQSRVSTVQKLRAVSNGSATKYNQEQVKTSRVSTLQKLRAVSNGSATKHDQKHVKTSPVSTVQKLMAVSNGSATNHNQEQIKNSPVSTVQKLMAVSNGSATKHDQKHVKTSPVSTVQKLMAVSNGSATKHDQEQIKTTARNGLQESDPTAAIASKFGAFVSRVADKLLDSKDPGDHNSVLERSTFVAEIRDKLQRLLPASAENGDLHGKPSIFDLVSRKIFKWNDNGPCAVSGDRNEGPCNSKLDKTSSSTCDVTSTQLEHRSAHADYSTGCTRSPPGKETCIDSCASAKEEALSRESTNGIGSRLLARLLETLSSSDTESDSSSSGEGIGAEWSLSDESEMSSLRGVPCTNKAFQHTTLCCQEFEVSSSSTDELSTACSGSDSSAGLCQRYYHVFHQGELVQLIQQGVASLDVVEEYYDHANWAVIAVKG